MSLERDTQSNSSSDLPFSNAFTNSEAASLFKQQRQQAQSADLPPGFVRANLLLVAQRSNGRATTVDDALQAELDYNQAVQMRDWLNENRSRIDRDGDNVINRDELSAYRDSLKNRGADTDMVDQLLLNYDDITNSSNDIYWFSINNNEQSYGITSGDMDAWVKGQERKAISTPI